MSEFDKKSRKPCYEPSQLYNRQFPPSGYSLVHTRDTGDSGLRVNQAELSNCIKIDEYYDFFLFLY